MSGTRPDDPTIGPLRAGVNVSDSPSFANRPRSTAFAPGSILAGRYRLVTLLGRGGMGEVYRADDLTLDQPVALKFLPENTAPDAAQLAQFHNELRTARQVSHKNVCRVYDLGEADGRRFITMEYVDGEDLASLIRRIGRVSPDKAVEIARQLCAGVAAAHERGVIHRDLKPANVMLDGQGQVRITDFGLAMTASDSQVVHAGTPQYMAPEQLRGESASVKSDLYALGLILFELFTGRRAHDAESLDQLRRWHDSGSRSSISTVVRDIDPAIDGIIQRCLQREPSARPASALAVAAALPGGDPLAAALAAGETPSPALIAAAGETDALHPAIGLSALAFILIGMFVLAMADDRTLLITKIPFNRSLDVLADRAGTTLRDLGFSGDPADRAWGTLASTDYLSWVARTDSSPSRWQGLASGSFPTIRFWYRTSPQPLEASERVPRFNDPPLTTPGMVSATFDTLGRLTSLAALPAPYESGAARSPADWSLLFRAAGLSMDRFHAVPPQRTPTMFADERMAWEGPLHEHDTVIVRVEAAARDGRPVFFTMAGPWSSTPGASPPPAPTMLDRLINYFRVAVRILVLVGGLLLARRHLHNGRGDRKSANRAFFVILSIWILIWAFESRHVMDLGREWNSLTNSALPFYIANAGLFWLMYIALEPFARRYCPEMLFAWTRLMGGQVRDARVGRDILVGLAAAVAVCLTTLAVTVVASSLGGGPPQIPRSINPQFLQGAGTSIAQALRFAPNALQNALLFTLVFVLARALTGKLWPAAVLVFTVSTLLALGETETNLVSALTSMVFSALFIGTLVRFGVVAVASAWFAFFLISQGPLTADFTRVYASTAGWLMAIIAGLACYAFYASRAGGALLGRLMPQD